MRSKLIILGCGSSIGVPRIDGYWGKCKKSEKKNIRTRCCALIARGSNNILVDVSPDIKYQLLSNKIRNISSAIFKHLVKTQMPGSIEQFERLDRAFKPVNFVVKGKFDEYGQEYEFGDEFAGLFGFRAVEVNPERAIKVLLFRLSAPFTIIPPIS